MTRLMALDYGAVRIGVAISDVMGMMAHPLEVIERRSPGEDIKAIRLIVEKYEISKIVMGLPLNMDGTPGMLTEEVQAFGRKIEEKTGVAIEYFDERLTTLQAERMLIEEADVSREKRKKVRDKVAASFILQAYLDSRGQ